MRSRESEALGGYVWADATELSDLTWTGRAKLPSGHVSIETGARTARDAIMRAIEAVIRMKQEGETA